MTIEDLQPTSPPAKTIKLWTPNTIAAITFFLGFPGGITLAAINWIKMGLKGKALTHIFIGVVGMLGIFLLPDNPGRIIGLSLTWGYIALLRQQMKSDIEKLNNSFNIQNAHWFTGCLMGGVALGALLITVGSPK